MCDYSKSIKGIENLISEGVSSSEEAILERAKSIIKSHVRDTDFHGFRESTLVLDGQEGKQSKIKVERCMFCDKLKKYEEVSNCYGLCTVHDVVLTSRTSGCISYSDGYTVIKDFGEVDYEH